ncbi:MAG: transglycosylase SLT domain-containing protein, partial [Armatimonadota bacterium]|nr:transglycosylase SLT domain-containing protein [Armatimonadota bacterium]
MRARRRQAWRTWSGAGFLILAVLLVRVAGCTSRKASPTTTPRFNIHPHYAALSRADLVIESQRKAVMGRRESLADVRRVVETVRPVVAEAVRQPEVEAGLRALAAATHLPEEELRARLQSLQEADLLLESGGDPNAVSPAGAVGVAQWMADTARRAGLRVDVAEYQHVVARGRALRAEIEAAYAQAPEWQASVAPGTPPVKRDEWIRQKLDVLRQLEKRRLQADERYDPRKAIFAQTRHLVRLWQRFGRIDWALQAYHGGVRGAERTIALYLGCPISAASPARVSFEEVYFGVSPRRHPRAFSYLYGRADDHRYYWWRILAAERALKLFRTDPARFEAWWEALAPGYPLDRAWYPDALSQPYADVEALRSAAARGELLPIPDNAARFGFAPRSVAPLDAANERHYRVLRAEALGMVRRVAELYRREGGREPLRVTGAAATVAYAARLAAAAAGVSPSQQPQDANPSGSSTQSAGEAPAPAPSGELALTLHAAGWCADIARPQARHDQHVLEYALGQLSDRMRLAWLRDRQANAYHLCPNPAFAEEMR